MAESYELSRIYTDEEFVLAWLDAYHAGRSARDVATELGLTTKHVYYRVDKLRGEGVDLPNFRERIIRRNKESINNLNDLIKNYKGNKGDDESED